MLNGLTQDCRLLNLNISDSEYAFAMFANGCSSKAE